MLFQEEKEEETSYSKVSKTLLNITNIVKFKGAPLDQFNER